MYLGVVRYNADERQPHVQLQGPDVLATGTKLSVTGLGSKSSAGSSVADADVLYSRRHEAPLLCCNPRGLHRDQRELSLKALSEKADQRLPAETWS